MQLKEIGKYVDIIKNFSGNGLVNNATTELLSDSIFNPDELVSFLDIINQYKELGIGTESVNTLLATSFEQLTGAQILEKVAVTDLTAEQKLLLIQKYAIDGANYQTVESIAAVTAAETAETGATVGLSKAFKGLAASMKAFATSTLGILTIGAAVGYGLYKIYGIINVSYEEHKEKLEEAKQAYTDAESEVESLQSQLDELNSKIEEINKQDTISLSDEEDLKNLVAETKELQRQLNIAKERAKYEGRKAEQEAVDTLQSKQVSKYRTTVSESGNYTKGEMVTSREELEEAINANDKYRKAVEDLQAQKDKLELFGTFEGREWEETNNQLNYFQNLLDETDEHIISLAEDLQSQSDSLIGATDEGDKLKPSVEESLQLYDEWYNRVNNVSEAFDTLSESEQKQVLINKLADKGYDYEKISKIVSNLSSDAFKTISDNFSDFEEQIDEVSEKSSDINVLSNSISRFVAEANKLKDGNVTRLSLSESLGDINSFKTEIESTTTAISALTTAVSEQYTQNYITQESYDALIDANSQFVECIEFGNGYMRLNVQQANELTKANAELKLSELDLKEALEVEQYNKNIEALKQLGDSDDELRAKLEAENSKIEENVRQYDLLEAQLLGVTSAYNDWIASQSAPDVGDQYDKMVSDYKKVEELYQKGLTGDAEFQAFNKLIGGEDAVTADFEKNLETFKRYFSETEVGINNFIDDIVRVNNLELNADGLYDGVVDWQKTMQELGLTHDEMQSLFDKLEQYEFHIDTTSGIDGLDDLKEHQSELNAEIENYRENIEKAKAQGIDTTDAENSLKSLQERYASITDEIVKMKDEASDGKITLDVDAELAKLDLSNISQEAQETLNKLKADNEQLKLSVQMGVDDTSYLEGKVKADLSLLKEQLKVPVETDSDTANKSIKELTQTATDFDKVINQAKTNTQDLGTIHVGDLGFNSLNSSVGNVNTSVSTLQRNLDTIASKTYTLKVTTSQEGKGKLLGTTGGFAFANGSGIAAQESSLSLTGELGRELVVRGNRWFTVGDNGAEFAHIKKGDIVFDAYQTSQLLDGSGKINSRGTALANGTAYVGENREETSKTQTSVTGLNHVHTKSGDSSTKKGKDKDKDKEDKKTKQLIDWIERRINVLTTKAEHWANIIEKATDPKKIDSYYKSLDTITKKQIKTYGDAYNRYMSKANSVGLSKSLINKIQSKDSALFDKNGNLKSYKKLIKEYGEKTAQKIQDYEQWYDKAISAIDNFSESVTKLANSPLEKASNQIDLLSKSMEVLDSKLKTFTVNDYAGANATINEQMANSKSQNEANKNALLKAQSKIDSVKGIKYDTLIKNGKKLNELDLSNYKLGTKKYKQAVKYNANVQAYNTALEAAQKSENELLKQNIEYRKQQFDNVQKYYDEQLNNIQAEYNSLENEIKLLETRGAFVTASWYKDQAKLEKDKLSTLNEERKALADQIKLLESEANGKYSEEWYECNKAIREVDASIQDVSISLSELNNKMNETTTSLIDLYLSVGDRAKNELNFVVDLMDDIEDFDMNHLVTSEGLARLESYTANMRVSAEQAGLLKNAVEKLQKAYSDGKKTVTIEGFGNYDFSAELSSSKKFQETINDFYDKWQARIKETYEYQSKVITFMRNKLKEELSALQDIINAKKESLNQSKSLRDYEKNVREQTTNIGLIQKQIAGVSGDTSEQGINRYLQLSKELVDAQEQLEETETDRMLSVQQEMLDKLSDEYSATIDSLSANTSYLLEEGNTLLGLNSEYIQNVYDELVKQTGYTEQFNLSSILSNSLLNTETKLTDIKDALNGTNNSILSVLTSMPSSIITAINDDNARQAAEKAAEEAQKQAAEEAARRAAEEEAKRAAEEAQRKRQTMGSQVLGVLNDSNSIAEYDKNHKYNTFNKYFLSTVYGEKAPLTTDAIHQLKSITGANTEAELVNIIKELAKDGLLSGVDLRTLSGSLGKFASGGIAKLVPASEDGLAFVRNGEGLISPENVKDIQSLISVVPQVNNLLQPMTMANLKPLNNQSIGDIQFNIEMNGVNDVETFSKQIREAYCSDDRIRKMIQSDNIMQLKSNSKSYNRNMYR